MRLQTPSLLALTLLLATAAAPARSFDRYAAESAILNSSKWVYSENADGTGYRERTIALEVRSEAAVRAAGVIGVAFASASEHVEFHYARVRHKDGSITETPITDAIEQPEEVTREAPFYSDLKQEQIPIRNLQVGDTLEWQARVVKTRADATNQFWGQDAFFSLTDGVALKETTELRVPSTTAVTVWTNPTLGIKPTETTEGTTRIYRWETSQLQPTAGDEADAARKASQGKPQTPAEELDAKEGKLPAIMWTTFKSWTAVGAWYRGLEGSRFAPDDEIKARVATLTAGKTTQEEKVRAVYAYVSAQIHYIGVAFGIGRFQPHEASDVLHNQYGDCKDKATLLASMLAVLGLHADSVLIGSELRINEAVPSPQSFNHLITRVKLGEKQVWLDPTTEVAPYQVLVYPLRDKLALVVPEQGPAELLRTPADLPFPSYVEWKSVGSLDKDGTSESHITMTMRGDYEVLYRAGIHQVSPGQYEQAGERLAPSLGYSGKVTHATFTRPEDTVDPFTFTFDYHREKAGDWPTLRTVAQVMPVPFPILDEKEPPSTPILLGIPHTETSEAEMKLPANWTAELPEAVHEKSKWATYDMTYRFEKGSVYTTRTAVILEDRIPVADWKAWKKFTDASGAGNEAYIQLRRGSLRTSGQMPPAPLAEIPNRLDTKPFKVSGPRTSPGVSPEKQAEIDTLEKQAFVAMAQKDVTTAAEALKKVQAIDPEARRLWLGLGGVATLYGETNEALDDYSKEMALYPDQLDVYNPLAMAQMTHGDFDAALATLAKWEKADPQNSQPNQMLVQMSFMSKKYSITAEEGEKALAAQVWDDSEIGAQVHQNLLVLTGSAELKLGQTAKGEARLKQSLEISADRANPGLTNNAVYALADAKLDLPLDEDRIRAVLAKQTAETQTWTLDESPDLLLQKSSLLVATWDTMGWVLFREGKTAEAGTYIEAAIQSHPVDEVRGHLAEIQKALGTRTQPGPAPGSQEARIVHLGPYAGNETVAEYRLLISRSGVIRMEPAKPDRTVPSAQPALKKINVAKYFPSGSDALLVKHGMVNCHAGKCDFVFLE